MHFQMYRAIEKQLKVTCEDKIIKLMYARQQQNLNKPSKRYSLLCPESMYGSFTKDSGGKATYGSSSEKWFYQVYIKQVTP